MYKTTASFFDGKTSAKHLAEVEFLPHQISISYINDGQESLYCAWELDRVAKDDVGVSSFTRLTYLGETKQVLEFEDGQVKGWMVFLYPNHPFSRAKFDATFGKNIFVLLSALVGVFVFLASIYYYGLPLFSDTVARIIPQYIENKYGEGIKNTYLRTESIDTTASHTLQLFFENLNFTKDINPQLYVVKSDVVNAFTFPGNTIIVFDEMIRRTETKEQLAALLAHEYSHMTQRHALRSMAANMSSGILLSIVVGDASGALGGLAQNVDQLRLLKYSRNFETEADTYGMQLLKQSKIDPSGMTGLFKILKKEEKNIIGNSNILDKLEFLSTHPLTEERIKNAEEVEFKKDYIVKENSTLQSLYNQLKLQTISVVF